MSWGEPWRLNSCCPFNDWWVSSYSTWIPGSFLVTGDSSSSSRIPRPLWLLRGCSFKLRISVLDISWWPGGFESNTLSWGRWSRGEGDNFVVATWLYPFMILFVCYWSCLVKSWEDCLLSISSYYFDCDFLKNSMFWYSSACTPSWFDSVLIVLYTFKLPFLEFTLLFFCQTASASMYSLSVCISSSSSPSSSSSSSIRFKSPSTNFLV